MVYLSPPLGETLPRDSAAAAGRRSADLCETGEGPIAAVTRGEVASPAGRSAAAGPPRSGGLESPLTVTPGVSSPSLTAPASVERGERPEDSVSVRSKRLDDSRGGRGGRTVSQLPGDAGVGAGRPGGAGGGSVWGGGQGEGTRMARRTVSRPDDDRDSSGASQRGARMMAGAGCSSRSKDIRDYF